MVLQGGKGGERHELVLRSGDVDLRELLGRQTLRALDLRNDFVASALNAEPVDIVSAQQGGQILSGLAQVNSLRAQLVAIEDDLGLRLVELQVGVGVDEQTAGESLPHQLLGEVEQLLRLARRGDYEINREISAAGQRRRSQRNHADARDLRQRPRGFEQKLLRGLFPLAPRLGHHAAEAAGRRRDLKDALALRERVINVVHLIRVQLRLIDGRVRRSLDHSEDHALILRRRQFPLREHVERNHQHGDNRPQRENHRPVAQRPRQSSRVSPAYAIEAAIDPARKSALGVARAQQLRSHHRRKRQRHDSGNDHGSRERECKLAEQRAGQAALNTDRRIHGGERDRHRDDRAHQFAGGVDGSPLRRLAHMNVALDVLHHDDRVIHHQADREHDGKQGQQVDGEAGHQHQEDRANQ